MTLERQNLDFEFIRSRVARDGAFGTKELFEKSSGTLDSPTALGPYDETWQQEHAGWDGAKYEDSLGMHVFQDTRTASVSADTVPLAYEIYGKLGGDTTQYDTNFMSIHADGKIVFNDPNGTRGFNQKKGTANISRDGSFVSNANITAVGNISGSYIIGDGSLLTNVQTSETITRLCIAAETITKGQAVAITGGTGDNPEVSLTNASSSSLMPAIGIALENITSSALGNIALYGEVFGIDTTAFTVGEQLYVSASIAGALTNVAPTGETNLIQTVGKVVRSNANGIVMVQGAGRTNATPNLNENNIFIGNATNQATTVALNNLTSDIATTGSLTLTAASKNITLNSTGRVHLGNIANTNNPLSQYTAGNSGFYYIQDKETEPFSYEFFMGAEVYAGSGSGDNEGVMVNWSRGRGNISAPVGPNDGDKVFEENFFQYATTKYPSVQPHGQATRYTYYDADIATYSDTVMPLTQEFAAYENGAMTGIPKSIMKLRPNRHIEFNAPSILQGSPIGLANITADGSFNSNANITAVGNIAGNYFTGNGSLLTGITAGGSTDSFGTILVAGETNIQATQANAQLTLASSGDITLTTAGNTVTIGGSGGSYGNANVTNFLASGTSTGNIAYTGNLTIESGNTSLTIDNYQGSVNTGSIDKIFFNSDPLLYIGQAITFSGTTNSDLMFLNGNTYWVRSDGGGYYGVYTDVGTTTGLQSGLGEEAPTGLVGSVRNENNTQAQIYGNVYLGAGSTLHTNQLVSATPGGTLSFQSVRMTDVGLGSGGQNFFFPETGGNTEGGILTAHSDQVGTWEIGLNVTTDNLQPAAVNYQNSRSDARGVEDIYKRSRGTTASPTALVGGADADRIQEAEYYGHDGTDYLNTFGEHTYVDTASNTVATGVMPLAREFYTSQNGVIADTPQQSIMKLRANRSIEFNANGIKGNGTQGNANISMDGSIYSAANINALNIAARQFIQLKNYTTTEINALTGMAAGDTVYNTTLTNVCVYNGSAWRKIVDETM